MAENEQVVYVKLGRDGEIIERAAATPADHVQFRGTGWVRKDSTAGKRVTNPKKSDDVSKLSASAVTAHAAAASVGAGETSTKTTTSSTTGTPKS